MSADTNDPILLDDFSDTERAAVEALLGEINLASTAAISAYCDVSSGSSAIEALSAMMERAPTTLLAGKIAEIAAKLQDADPRKMSEKAGWFARVTGADLEGKIRYQVSRKAVETLLEEAERLALRVTDLVDQIERMLGDHASESAQLGLRLAAGKLFLQRHPEAGLPPAGEIAFDNPRERFARRLTSLAALLSSNEMSATQMKLARAQAIDMVERFHEIRNTLVPIWRQHTMALVSSVGSGPEAIAVAAQAHESLLTQLSALKGSAR